MDDQLAKLQVALNRVKLYYPYRIVWGYVDPDTFEIVTSANVTKRQANDMMRKGYHIYTV